MSETETYKIRRETIPMSAKCQTPGCGHVYAAHGSNGKVCAACLCRQFLLEAPSE